MLKRGKRQVMPCIKCKQSTTHEYRQNKFDGSGVWECLCCESAKYRTKEQIVEIKKTRKKWAKEF